MSAMAANATVGVEAEASLQGAARLFWRLLRAAQAHRRTWMRVAGWGTAP